MTQHDNIDKEAGKGIGVRDSGRETKQGEGGARGGHDEVEVEG
jgi:hypothetical protein